MVVSLVLLLENVYALLFLVTVVAVTSVSSAAAVGERVLEIFKNVFELSEVLRAEK